MEKPIPTKILRPIIRGVDVVVNQSEFLAITRNLLKARRKFRVKGVIGFSFVCHCLKNWRDIYSLITKRSNRNRAITFDSHLKTAL